MIFVTVGTHEQQFNRLLKKIDQLKYQGVIREEVLMQTGYSTYVPEHCQWRQWIPYREMIEFVAKARIVITHGGPSSFMLPLQVGKTPIVVPRKTDFEEHINNHQVKFCNAVAERYGSIYVVEDIDKLGDVITGYRNSTNEALGKRESNNAKFNAEFAMIIDSLIKNDRK